MKLGSLALKDNFKLMMMGSLETEIAETQAKPENLPEVVNDFDIEEEEVALQDKEIYLEKIAKRVRDYEVKVLNPSRENKKLLVLDIDYTLFDHRLYVHHSQAPSIDPPVQVSGRGRLGTDETLPPRVSGDSLRGL